MTRWEYATLFVADGQAVFWGPDGTLRQLGSIGGDGTFGLGRFFTVVGHEGWELVTADGGHYRFKRPLQRRRPVA